ERVNGYGLQFVIGMKKSQHVALGPNDVAKPPHYGAQQGGFKILQHVPNENPIKMRIRIFERLAKKVVDAAGVRLLRGVFAAESLPEELQKILGVNTVTEICYEGHILLRCTAQIQNSQAGLSADISKELLQAPALTRGLNGRLMPRPGRRCPDTR